METQYVESDREHWKSLAVLFDWPTRLPTTKSISYGRLRLQPREDRYRPPDNQEEAARRQTLRKIPRVAFWEPQVWDDLPTDMSCAGQVGIFGGNTISVNCAGGVWYPRKLNFRWLISLIQCLLGGLFAAGILP